jgi:hypothetical protein
LRRRSITERYSAAAVWHVHSFALAGRAPSCCGAQLSLLGEQPSLGIGEAKTLGPEPGPQHAVLGAQVLDRFALPATDPAATSRTRN